MEGQDKSGNPGSADESGGNPSNPSNPSNPAPKAPEKVQRISLTDAVKVFRAYLAGELKLLRQSGTGEAKLAKLWAFACKWADTEARLVGRTEDAQSTGLGGGALAWLVWISGGADSMRVGGMNDRGEAFNFQRTSCLALACAALTYGYAGTADKLMERALRLGIELRKLGRLPSTDVVTFCAETRAADPEGLTKFILEKAYTDMDERTDAAIRAQVSFFQASVKNALGVAGDEEAPPEAQSVIDENGNAVRSFTSPPTDRDEEVDQTLGGMIPGIGAGVGPGTPAAPELRLAGEVKPEEGGQLPSLQGAGAMNGEGGEVKPGIGTERPGSFEIPPSPGIGGGVGAGGGAPAVTGTT